MAKKKKGYCNLYAQVKVKGKYEDSSLHRSLLKDINNRPVANLVYAMYKQPGVDADMDSKGYVRNPQGEHWSLGVLKYLGFEDIETDLAEHSIREIEELSTIATRDKSGKLVDFTDPLVAIERANKINHYTRTTSSGKDESAHAIANVVRHGNTFQVITTGLSDRNYTTPRNIDNLLFLWEKLKDKMNLSGVDLDSLRIPFSDIMNITDPNLIGYMRSLSQTNNKYFSLRELEFIMTANLSSALVLRAVALFGSILDAALAYFDTYHNPGSASARAASPYSLLLERAINDSKNLFSVLDQTFIDNTIGLVQSNNQYSLESAVVATLNSLNKRFGINPKQFSVEGNQISKLSDAVVKSIVTLERQITRLESQLGTLDERRNLALLKDKLTKELESKRYYAGMLDYLANCYKFLDDLDSLYRSLPNTGTPFENAVALAKIIHTENMYLEGNSNMYYDIIKALANIEDLTIDESISSSEIDALKLRAKGVYDLAEKIKTRNRKQSELVMIDIARHILGDKVGKESIENVVRMCSMEGSLINAVYSFGKLSDPLVAAMGDITRTQQDIRDEKLLEFRQRIATATDMLYNTGKGSNSKFMYEKVGDRYYIVSDIDWEAYHKEYNRAKKQLVQLGKEGYDLEEAMEQWEDLNLEDVVVDNKSGRTERLPTMAKYRKRGPSFRDSLTAEQKKYYDTMMLIKGEIGTLLPEYAQHQYLPPLLRRDWINAVSNAKTMKEGLSATWDKMSEAWLVKEDNTTYGLMAYKPNEAFARGDLSGKEYRLIPIFFTNKISNQDELLLNFSAGVLALASTALNYNSMSQIVDLVEFMRDYIDMTPHKVKIKSKVGSEVIGGKKVTISDWVTKKSLGDETMSIIMNNMMDKHFYGINLKGLNPFWNLIIKDLTFYTSYKGLSTNWAGGMANLVVGEDQTFLMALANTLYRAFHGFKQDVPYFGLTDWAIGFAKLWKEPVKAATTGLAGTAVSAATRKHPKGMTSVLWDLNTRNKQSKDYLLSEYFNLFNENFSEFMRSDYYKGFRQVVHDPSFWLYSAGEKAIRFHTLWAMLHSHKVIVDGKSTTLDNMFVKSGSTNTPVLKYRPNVTTKGGIAITDSTGELTEEGKEYMMKFKKDLRLVCQGMFGAMNDEDKGIIHMHALGRMGMNFRQWMVGHYSERFRGLHWDMDKKEFVRGYWTSAGEFAYRVAKNEEVEAMMNDGYTAMAWLNMLGNLSVFRTRWTDEWAKSTPTQRLDLMRVMSAVITYTMLVTGMCMLGGGMVPILWLGDDDDEKKRVQAMDTFEKFCYYQGKRLIMEMDASHPIGAVNNWRLVIKNPVPALATLNMLTYPILGYGDLNETLKSGPNKGENKYWRNIKKYSLPWFKDWYRYQNFSEDYDMFGLFEQNRSVSYK